MGDKISSFERENVSGPNPQGAVEIDHRPAPQVKEGEEKEPVVNPLNVNYGEPFRKEEKPIPDYRDQSPEMEGMVSATQKAQAIHKSLSAKIAEKYKALLARLDKLRDDRIVVQDALITKRELLPLAVEKFKTAQEEARKYLLIQHLNDCRLHPGWLFDRLHFGRYMRIKENLFFTLLFSEQDIEDAVLMLPDDGMPQEDRENKIKAIDRESAKISKQIETEFADLEKE